VCFPSCFYAHADGLHHTDAAALYRFGVVLVFLVQRLFPLHDLVCGVYLRVQTVPKSKPRGRVFLLCALDELFRGDIQLREKLIEFRESHVQIFSDSQVIINGVHSEHADGDADQILRALLVRSARGHFGIETARRKTYYLRIHLDVCIIAGSQVVCDNHPRGTHNGALVIVRGSRVDGLESL